MRSRDIVRSTFYGVYAKSRQYSETIEVNPAFLLAPSAVGNPAQAEASRESGEKGGRVRGTKEKEDMSFLRGNLRHYKS